jgi:nucleoside-diphosphate kinase
LQVGRNLTHASDKPESGEREVALWFQPNELVTWEREIDRWVFEG